MKKLEQNSIYVSTCITRNNLNIVCYELKYKFTIYIYIYIYIYICVCVCVCYYINLLLKYNP